jgi:transcriptional regulator with XRE-family HTH domain
MNEASVLIDKLKQYYKVGTIQELAKKLGVKQNTISGWKQRNSVNAIKRKIYELDLQIDTKQENISIDDDLNEIYSLIIDNAAYTAKQKLVWKFDNDIVTALNAYFAKDILKEVIKDLASDKNRYTPENMKNAFLERLKGIEVGIIKVKKKDLLSFLIERYFSKLEVYALVHYPEIVFDYAGYFSQSKFDK